MTPEPQYCRQGDDKHRWPEIIERFGGSEAWRCNFCGDDWDESH